MADVDDKVVSIKFDNASFEKKLSETIASLDKLRASLDMAGAKRGLEDLSKAGKNFNMGEMSASVDGISAKFLAMSTIAITALSNITTRALEAGAHIASAFTIAPITGGFQEFELKMGSIQTIMAGSGESLETVNQKLQELNAYSDRTIYSFKDMTSNIGKFTNAGVSLDKSVSAIQGVANVAALSGANAEEASRAMYNFAQSISTGSVKLMDWKSIELANMGTTEFKQQLIDTAVAMGTLNKTGDGMYETLKGTAVSTTQFNQTLQEGWLTSEALTETLGRFADATTEIGGRATAAATDVKTFSQMIDTIKESIGSGWAQSFEAFFGNFEEGKKLWTGLNNAIGGFIGRSADARNEMLGVWHDFKVGADGMTSREVFFKSLGDVFKFLGDVIRPIGEAFRQIFPKKTGADLVIMTDRFAEFVDKLKIGDDTVAAIKNVFTAFFAVLDIGWEIIKGVATVFFALVKGVWSVVGPLFRLTAGTGGFVESMHEMLVTGGGIKTFFATLAGFVLAPFDAIVKVTGAVVDFFQSLDFGRAGKTGIEEAAEGAEKGASLFDKILEALKNVFGQIGDFVGGIIDTVAGAFGGLGDAIAGALGSGDFSNVINIIKTGLLGGILTMLVKFFRNGLKFDFGQGALMDKLGGVLDTITSGLKSLQANVRADTLLKIAGAMGILALAVIALSLIDPGDLAKAMGAIAGGLTMLTTVMLLLEKAQGPASAAKILAMSVGITALAGSMILLALAMKIIGTMDLDDLGKGLLGVVGGLLAMSFAMKIIGSADSLAGVVRAGISMILIAGALIVLAFAIKKFAEMDLMEMGVGLGMAALGIGVLIMALKNMPDDIAAKGIGLFILALSLRSLAKVVQMFAGIDNDVLFKGFAAISIGLSYLGAAMQMFPDDMIQKSIGMIALSAALYIMGLAIKSVGEQDLGTLAKGILGLTIMLTALAVAVAIMDGAKGGVGALLLAAVGLLVIGRAIKEVGAIPFDELLKGILGLAAVLAVLAIASIVAPGIALLGVALLLVGAGLALVGAGIALAGKGLELFAKYGSAALGFVIEGLQEVVRQLPGFVSAFVAGIIEGFIEIGNKIPELIDTIVKILTGLLDAVIEIIPKLAEVLTQFIESGLQVIIDSAPEWAEAGFALVVAFLQGIADNVGEITNILVDTVIGFIDALAGRVAEMVSSLVELLVSVITAVAYELGGLAPTLMIDVGLALVRGMYDGVTQALGGIFDFFKGIITDIINIFKSGFGIFSPSRVMMDIGINIIQGLINGLISLIGAVADFFITLPGKVLGWIGEVIGTLFTKGFQLIAGLLSGIVSKAKDVINFFTGLPGKIVGYIGNVAGTLINKGVSLLGGLLSGLRNKVGEISRFFLDLPGKILGYVAGFGSLLLSAGKALVGGLVGGIKSVAGSVGGAVKDLAGGAISGVGNMLGIGGPSRVMCELGKKGALGLANGFAGDTSVERATNQLARRATDSLRKGLRSVPNLAEIADVNPVIKPVLDLSQVQKQSRGLNSLMNAVAIRPDISVSDANAISALTVDRAAQDETPAATGPTEVNFHQTINAPKELSTNDIYRGTKSQLAIAKERLGIAS